MEKHRINDFMDAEEILFLIKKKCIVDLSLSEIINLYNELDRIGKITNIFFKAQYDVKDDISQQELKIFHQKLLNDEIDFDLNMTVSFMKKITTKVKDEELLGKIKLFINKWPSNDLN